MKLSSPERLATSDVLCVYTNQMDLFHDENSICETEKLASNPGLLVDWLSGCQLFSIHQRREYAPFV